MDKKTSVLAAVAGVVLVAVLVIVAVSERRPAPAVKKETGETVRVSTSSSRREAPANIAVPEVNEERVPENVAVPQVVAESVRDAAVSSKYRRFEVRAENDRFIPDTVIVNQGDSVQINLLAVDKDYDFTQPEKRYNFPLRRGNMVPLAFTAAGEGDFLFYCVVCGGPEKGPTGHIIVVPKK